MVVEIFVTTTVADYVHVRCPLADGFSARVLPSHADEAIRSARATALLVIVGYQVIPDRIEFREIRKEKS